MAIEKSSSIFIVTLCLATVALGLASQLTGSQGEEWLAYKLKHGKHYVSRHEDQARFKNFLESKRKIERHNSQKPEPSYKMGLNHMADWHQSEYYQYQSLQVSDNFLQQLKDKRVEETLDESNLNLELSEILGLDELTLANISVPDELDWRQVPERVSAVKDQSDHCGSCWAFATTGMLEGQMVARNFSKKLIPLSEQQLVDCSDSDNGCNGGSMENALDDIKSMGGITSEKDYPYEKHDDTCKFKRSHAIMTVKGSKVLDKISEKGFKKLLSTYGPISVAIEATHNLQLYHSGLFKDFDCQQKLNHGVLVVGYGTDKKTKQDYWIVKNSWGQKWGEAGYFRLFRGVDMCGVRSMPTMATF